MNDKLDFEPKRILKHKNHITLNEGENYDTQVQHLEKKDGKFIELKKNEAARKYGSKKLVRDLDFKSRDGLQVKESGLENTPKWFPQLLPFIEWEEHRTLLYEMDHLWLNMFFVRELYGEEQTGREQIIELKSEENGLGLNVLAELDYQPKYKDTEYEDGDVDAFIKVSIDKEEKEDKEGREGREYGINVDFKQSFWTESDAGIASGLREIMTGIALKHDHTDEQLHLQIEEQEDGFQVQVLNKDFALRFNEEGDLESGVSPWVCEMLNWDGCPLNMETIKVTE
jgi:hypothetical protein